MTTTPAPVSAAHDVPVVAIDLDGQVDRAPKWWVYLAAPMALGLMVSAGLLAERSAWLTVATVGTAVAIILLIVFRGFPRLLRMELHDTGIHLFGDEWSEPIRVLPWRRLAQMHVPGVSITGYRDLRLFTWPFLPPLVFTLRPAEAHAMAATIHDARARHDRTRSARVSADRQPPPDLPCLACGYDRTGLPESSPCPECGSGSCRVTYSTMAWPRAPGLVWWWLVAVSVAAVGVLVVLVGAALDHIVALTSVVGLLTLLSALASAVVVGIVLAVLRPESPPTLAVFTHDSGITIRRVGGSPTTIRWNGIVSVRAGRRSGWRRSVEIVGLVRPLAMRNGVSLREPEVDLLAAAIHRGLADHVERRTDRSPRHTAARQAASDDPDEAG